MAIEYRWAENHVDRLPTLAAEFVREQVAVIVAVGGVPPTQAAKAMTSTIPIVFIVGGDPIKLGLVASQTGQGLRHWRDHSLRRAHREATGTAARASSAGECCLSCEPKQSGGRSTTDGHPGGGAHDGKELRLLSVSNDHDLDAAFATLTREQIGGLLLANDAFFVGRREQIVALAARHAVPTMYFLREFATVGGLMSYGSSLTDAYHRIGISTGKILRGVKPADLPVEQVVKIELVINLKTAKALGLEMPPSRPRAPTR